MSETLGHVVRSAPPTAPLPLEGILPPVSADFGPAMADLDGDCASSPASSPMDPLTRELLRDFKYRTLPNILLNCDRASMAHGIEVRVPLLDHRIVQAAFATRATEKLRGPETKAMLGRAMAGHLPPDQTRRAWKRGFNPPVDSLTTGRFGQLVLDTCPASRSTRFA